MAIWHTVKAQIQARIKPFILERRAKLRASISTLNRAGAASVFKELLYYFEMGVIGCILGKFLADRTWRKF